MPVNERWSAQFPSGGEEKLIGKVLSHSSENPVIIFDYDGKSTTVPLAKVTAVCEVCIHATVQIEGAKPYLIHIQFLNKTRPCVISSLF